MTTTKQHDYLNRLQNISSHPGGSVKSGKRYWSDHMPVAGQQNEYTFDDIGNRTATKAGGDENGANLRSATYTSNTRNQYTARTIPNTFDVLGIANLGATVTVNGNATYRKGEYFRKELTVTNNSAAVWMNASVQALNGASSNTVSGNVFVPLTSESLTYDADGNLIEDGRGSYTWDAENRLMQFESHSGHPAASKRKVAWEYDSLGRRIREKTYDGSSGSYVLSKDLIFLNDGWRCIAELNAANNALVRSYAWGLDMSGSLDGAGGVGGLLWLNSAANGVHFHAMDGNGNVAALVKGTDGTVTANYEYDVFGQSLRATGTMALENEFCFSTKRNNRTLDLVLYEYRPYSPSLGRFLNRDPISELGFRTVNGYKSWRRRDESNPYAFVANRPIDWWDVLGLYAGGATSGEIKDIIAEVGLDGSWAIRNTDSDAKACAAGVSPEGSSWGGEQDAVRHCVWLCLMSEKVGCNSAMAVAGIHEKHHPPPTVPKPPTGYSTVEDWSKADTAMDNSNNNVGAQLGRACGHKNCCSECKSALKQGLLKVNSPGGYEFGP